MKPIIFNVHSIIDLITNSSSEIYTTCTVDTVNNIKELINTVLKLSNSELVADDLFEIRTFQNTWKEWQDENGKWQNDEVKDYDNVDFDHESIPVYVELVQKQGDEDLTKLLTELFTTKEFMA